MKAVAKTVFKKAVKKPSGNEVLFTSPFGKVFMHYREIVSLYEPDYLVEYGVRKILEQLLGSEFHDWVDWQKDAFMEAYLVEVKILSQNVVSDSFLEEKLFSDNSKRKKPDADVLKSILNNKYFKAEEFAEDKEEADTDRRVHLLHFNEWLVLLKEKWPSWSYYSDKNYAKAWRDREDTRLDDFTRSMAVSHMSHSHAASDADKTADSHHHDHDESFIGKANDSMQEFVQHKAMHIYSGLFDVVAVIKLDNPMDWNHQAHHNENVRIRFHTGT